MNLLPVKDAAIELGKSPKTLYSQSSRDKALGRKTRFVWTDGTVLVNIDAFEDGKIHRNDAVTSDTQEEFERLYFYITDRQSKQSMYEMIGVALNKSSNAVRGYMYDMFLTGTETTKKQYVEVMKKIADKYVGESV